MSLENKKKTKIPERKDPPLKKRVEKTDKPHMLAYFFAFLKNVLNKK